MITVRHRATHENRTYVVWQFKSTGQPTRYAATFDVDRESVVPTSFPHPTMFRAVDAMLTGQPDSPDTTGQVVSKTGQTMSEPTRTSQQLQLWD